MQFSVKSEDTDNEYFYQLIHWFLHRLTCPDARYPTAEIPGLYHFSFKSYKPSLGATFFQKWILVKERNMVSRKKWVFKGDLCKDEERFCNIFLNDERMQNFILYLTIFFSMKKTIFTGKSQTFLKVRGWVFSCTSWTLHHWL